MAEPEPATLVATTSVLKPGSPHLESVRSLWRANSETLGFLPSGAFNEAAFAGRIIGAVDATDMLVGYVLFRTPSDRAVVVHLCIAPAWRGRGVTAQLLAALRAHTGGKRGLGLTCRRDYDATRVWPKLGFRWVRDEPARAEGKFLSLWWLDYQQPDLFSRMPQSEPKRLAVALDQNVFYDMHGTEDLRRDVESESLVADWVQEEIELVVTDEVFNEIGRSERTTEERASLARLASTFRHVSCDQAKFEAAMVSLRDLFPPRMDESTESDLRHVARAVACGVQVFVTRDDELLNLSEELFQRHGLTVKRPSTLVTTIDEVRREHVYQPGRVAGTLLQERRLGSSDDLQHLLSAFQRSSSSESKSDFLAAIRKSRASPTTSRVQVIGSAQDVIGLTTIDVRDGAMVVTMLRQSRGPTGSTVARFMAERLVRQATEERAASVRVEDRHLDDDMRRALGDAGFQPGAGETWIKQSLFGLHSVEDAPRLLKTPVGISTSREDLWTAEHVFRPLKFWDLDVPTHVVPIQPRWAAELFDAELAGELLFGAKQDLAFRAELVYYRSPKPGLANLPGRLLWYVSAGGGEFSGRSRVRAYSRIDEVVVGDAKEVFRRFRRLGVYRWPDVQGTAKGGDGRIMAIRFSGTELFPRPVSWQTLQSCLEAHGKRSQIQSPTKISATAFREIYSLGHGL